MESVKHKILLIEDNQVDRKAFGQMVAKAGLAYRITIVPSVSEAKAALKSDSFDIVIADYSLCDGTAFDVLDLTEDTPVIFATGAGNEEVATKTMKAGAYDYLIKDHARSYLEVLPIVIDKAIKHREVEKELKAYHDGLETLVSQRTEELAAEKELLGITLTSMSDGIIAVDVAGRIILFNEVAEELTGWKFEEVKGKAVNEVLHIVDEQTNEPLESVIDKSLESGTTEYGTQNDAIVSQEGKTCPISASAAPIRKAEGTIMGVVLAFRNVTKEREIDRMKTDLVSSVSHELRTPLTSIKAFTATILRDPAMPDETRLQFLKIVDEESNRLSNLIENLLEISRIESSSLQIDLEPVSIPEVVDRILPGLEVLAARKKIELVKDLREALPPLMGDAGKIQSVMTNLVNNAIKFTPDGGRVTITAEHVGDELVVSVSDTGLGIPREALEKIFNRFYRVGRPGMQIKGTGLGLAIVKRIVQMHGGRIDVVSKPEQGSTFSIHFPLSGAKLPAA